MKIDKFNKLKGSLETFAFEKNFYPLSTTLYWFSFLGNIFLVLFSYFFIKDVTNSIPELFKFQDIFFSVFIFLFMSGYELFKRFSFEQLTLGILKTQRFTVNIFVGISICLALVAGSFYLSLNGAHRLIDNTEAVETTNTSFIENKIDSVNVYYNEQIQLNQSAIKKLYESDRDGILGPAATRTLNGYQSSIKKLDSTRMANIEYIENRYANKTDRKLERIQQNDVAFAFMVFFLELIILVGVGFHSYYVWTAYNHMDKLLKTTKFQELGTHLKLLQIIYENGKNTKDDLLPGFDKIHSICELQGLELDNTDLNKFVNLCYLFGILHKHTDNKYTFEMDFENAKRTFEGQFYM